MSDINKMSSRTRAYLSNINKNTLKPSLKPERSPSEKKVEPDNIDIDFSGINDYKQAEESEMVSVILSTEDITKRNALLSGKADDDPELPRKVTVEGKLESGEIIAKVDKKFLSNLERAGFNVISNEEQMALPAFPEISITRDNSKKAFFSNVARLNVVNASAKMDEIKATGKNVSIAILDTGVSPHPDIKDKIVAFKDFVNSREEPYDDNGHGTHVAGDAAGTGAASDGKYKGTAPDANIVGVKILNSEGGTKVSDVVKGIDWVIENREKYNIRIINMSIGVPSSGYQFDLVDKAVERANKAGIVVVAAAGNEGPNMGTIGSAPGNSPLAITVGAIDDNNTVEKEDDTIARFSSRGPTLDGLIKPDIVAPGVDIISLNITGSKIDKMAKAVKYLRELPDEKLKELPKELYAGLDIDYASIIDQTPSKIRRYLERHLPKFNYINEYYVGMPGTSMATPLTSGVIADMLEVNPELSPGQVKDILKKTADDMSTKNHSQGSGSLDPVEAIYSASTTRGELSGLFSEKTKGLGVGYLISGSGGNT